MARQLFIRDDGEAANKAAAVGPSDDKTKCMDLAAHNNLGDNFLPDDNIFISDRGGDFDCSSILLACPNSGILTQPIVYSGEENHLPIFHAHDTGTICLDSGSLNYLTFNDIDLKNATSSNVLNDGGSLGLIYNRCRFFDSGDQNTQNIGTVDVTYNDCETSGAADDGHSLHNDANVKVNGGRVFNNKQGINAASGGVSQITCVGVEFKNNLDFAISAQNVTAYKCLLEKSITGDGFLNNAGNFLVQSCILNGKGSTISDRFLDHIGAGHAVFNNNVFYNDDGDGRGMWCRTGIGSMTVSNNIFQGLWNPYYTQTGATVIANNNCYNGNTSLHIGTGTLINNSPLNSDPLMVDPFNGDFRLTKDSPCRDYGTDSIYSSVVEDFFEKLMTDITGTKLNEMPSGAALFQSGDKSIFQPIFKPIFQNIFQGIHK